jgi:hypothetical protein
MGKLRSYVWVLAMLVLPTLIGCSSSEAPREQRDAVGARLPIALLSSPRHAPRRRILLAISKAMKRPVSALAKDVHQANTSYGPLWLVRLHGTLCLLTKLRVGYSCSPDASVVGHGLTLGLVINPSSNSSRYFVIFGVVRNKVKRVVVKVGRRGCALVTVENNAFAFRNRSPVWLTGARSCPLGR